MKFTLYPHGGSGNHGCEAIIRSTAKLLKNSEITLFSTNPEQDLEVGLDRLCTIQKAEKKILFFSLSHIVTAFRAKVFSDKEAYDKATFNHIIKNANYSDFFLSIGGDNYCYGANSYIYLVNKMIDRSGTKRILWGASIEPESLDGDLLDDLQGFHKIWARESLTYDALQAKGLTQTVLMPDPAFILDRKDLPFPKNFQEGNIVGINVSPMIIGYEKYSGIVLENYTQLINYILEKTDMQIALIPHVVWEHNDDRIPLNILYNQFKYTGRICIIGNHNAEELKGYIGRCRFMIAARTHASIAAYSTQVPTLVVGYSIKAKGIAKDIMGSYENYVLPVQSLQNKEDLKNYFIEFKQNESKIRDILKSNVPNYINNIDLKSIIS